MGGEHGGNDKHARVAVDLRDPAQLIAFGFGSGLAPKAPGTFGTLAAVPLYLLLLQFPWPVYVVATLAIFVLGVWASDVACRRLGVHDHSGIVIDEFAGFLVTMLPAVLGLVAAGWATLLAGFLLFRFFDVLKPWPIRVLDRRVHGGFGVMLDDLVAGLFAAAALWAAFAGRELIAG
ncbi:MAG: phosphatidylglycerophosphatase A [Pseudomonadota bacterium]